MNQTIIFQRIEAAAIFIASCLLYWHLNFNILLLVLLLSAFDISMLGYLVNNKVGALGYNLGHSMIAPSLLFALGFVTDTRILVGFSLIWFAHIGVDRSLGYGLKLTSGFKDTHLGKIG